MADYDILAEYSLNLLRGQMLTQLMGMSHMSGLSLNEFILGHPGARRSGKEMMQDALTGLLRSDVAMLRQGSKNLEQGKALLQSGDTALENISTKITRMREIVEAMRLSPSNAAQLEAEYDDLSASVSSSIENTSFNGLKILDSQGWDERVRPAGAVGKLELQSGNSSSEITLYDLSLYKNHFTSSTDLAAGNLDVTAGELGAFTGMLDGLRENYQARAGLLDAEAVALERQADILQEATGKAKPNDWQSLREILLDLLLREHGSVADGQA